MILSELIARLVDARITLTLNNDGISVEAPKGALVPEIMTALKIHKADLIEHLKASHTKIQKIHVVEREKALALSFAQHRLWLLDQIDGSSAHYNIPGALRLRGRLHVDAFNKAFTTILERHESLRTCFVAGD